MSKPFYLTTTLPYVNADPHLGFALEIVRADVLVRYRRSLGENVFFNTGTDEHGLKIFRQAQAVGQTPQEFVDVHAAKFRDLQKVLGLSPDINFIRTTDPQHVAAAQQFWQRCAADDIYKKTYRVKYCVGCELEKTDSELVGGKCEVHPNLEMELIEEENYFFRFSKYQQKLLDLYESRPDFVVPGSRLNEVKAFVGRGLEDFSISRLREKMPWGVPVPGDEQHVMYVWFDALVNYISTLGWPEDEEKFNQFWREGMPTQFAGKDNLRQQAAMWQAMLMSADLPPTHQIVIHGFINSGGQKMSKSVGNVLSPVDLVNEFGVDAVRYYLLRHVNDFEDSDVTYEKIKEAYNANLANGLGNLVNRVLQLSSQYLDQPVPLPDTKSSIENVVSQRLDVFEFSRAMDAIWSWIQDSDQLIQERKPFEVVKTDKEAAKKQLTYFVMDLVKIANSLAPFMPGTSEKIIMAIIQNKKPVSPLFPRKD